MPKSSVISRYIFINEGGSGIPSFTKKHRPQAYPAPWYGSCPNITTLVSENEHESKTLNMSEAGGYTIQVLYSCRTKSVSCSKYDLSNSACKTSFHECSIRTSIIVYLLRWLLGFIDRLAITLEYGIGLYCKYRCIEVTSHISSRFQR